MAFILASASPRRRQLLRQVGADFQVESSPVEEIKNLSLAPEEMIQAHNLIDRNEQTRYEF